MASAKGFSGEYWQLHRNTMIFSAALLVIAVSSTTSNLKILDLDLGGIGSGAITFLLILAATYSFIAFFLEWVEECWPGLKEQVLALTEARKDESSTFISLDNATVALDTLVSYYKDYRDHLERSYPKASDENVQSLIEHIKSRHEEHLESRQMHEISPSPDDLKRIELQNEERRIGARWYANHLLQEWIEFGYNSRVDMDDRIKEVIREIGKVNDNILSVRKSFEKISLKINIPSGQILFRSMIVAMVFPAALYIVAMMHGVGRMGYVVFPYSLAHIIKDMK